MRESWLQTATFGGKVVQSFQFSSIRSTKEKRQGVNEALQEFPLGVVQVGEKGFSGFLGKGLIQTVCSVIG